MSGKITLVTINNPFDLNNREIKQVDYTPETTLMNLVKSNDEWIFNGDFVVCVDGAVINHENLETTAIVPGSYVSIAPAIKKGGDGKSILGLVAGIALSIVSMGVGNLVAYGSWTAAAGMAGWSYGAYFAAAATMYLGGMLISNMTPAAKIDLPDFSTSEQSYSWSNSQPLLGQGYALGIVYGKVNVTPNIIAQHIVSSGSTQWLDLLMILCDGPIDEINTIKINDNPIEYYNQTGNDDKNVIYKLLYGTNHQEDVSYYVDYSKIDQVLSYELTTENGWLTQLMESNSAEGFELEFTFPNGLAYVNDQGGLSNTKVTLAVEYRLEGESTWKKFYNKNSDVTTTGGFIQSPIIKNVYENETFTIEYLGWGSNGIQGYGYKFSVTGSVTGAKPDIVITDSSNSYYYSGDIFQCRFVNYMNLTVGAEATFNVNGSYEFDIFNATNTAYRVNVQLDHLSRGRYEVRSKCVAKDGNTTRYNNKVYWTRLSGIIYDRLTRPGKAMLALHMKATGQLSNGLPELFCVVSRKNVWVWNPYTGAYVQNPADNPAWAAYDLIHRAKLLYDYRDQQNHYEVFGAPYSQIIYDEFKRWADLCDANALKVNIVIDKSTDLWSALKDIESCGRGKVIMKGTRYGAVADGVASPVQLFTMGNIIKDSFREDYLGQKERANAIEVSFLNAAKNYSKDTFTVYTSNYDTAETIVNPTQITLEGITDYDQAYKEACYRLRLNKYLIRTVSFEVETDAIACQVGDVVNIQHDVPKWGSGGRIMAVDGLNLTLDCEVEMQANVTYGIMVRNYRDSIIWRTLTTSTEYRKTNIVTLTSAPSDTINQYDVFCFGEFEKEAKPFRIVNITREQEMTRKITALEYVVAVYVETMDFPVINYSSLTKFAVVKDIVADHETFTSSDGSPNAILHLSWQCEKDYFGASKFRIFYGTVGMAGNICNEQHIDIENLSLDIPKIMVGFTYSIKICPINALGQVGQPTTPIEKYIYPKDIKPPDVTGLAITTYEADTTKILLTWNKVTAPDLKGYVIIAGGTTDISQIITDNNYTYHAAAPGEVKFQVKAVDNSGNRSENASLVSHTFVNIANVTNFTVTADSNNKTKVALQWTANSEKDISYYEIRVGGSSWETASVIASKLKTTFFNYQLPSAGAYTFRIKAFNLGGFESTNAVTVSNTFSFNPSNISGLTATQSNLDKSRVKLSWPPVSDSDFDHYILKVGGASWNDATLLQSNVTTTFFDTTINSESTYIYRIAAVNKAGYESAIPLSITQTFNLKPAQVTNLAIVTRSDDKTTAVMTWNEVTDADLLEYEIRLGGTVWDNSTLLVKTKERSYIWKLAATGSYIVRIRAKNASGFYSTETTTNYTATVEPSNITGFVAMQNGENILLAWNKNEDADFAYYEIHEGSTYDNGSLLVTGLTVNTFEFMATTETTRSFHIKAFNRAGKKSVTAATAYIVVSGLLPKNIINTYNEITLQSGTLTNAMFGASNFTFASLGGKFSDYPTTRFSDVGGQTVLKLAVGQTSGNYVTAIKDMGQIISANISVKYVPSVLIGGGSAALLYSTSTDNASWSDYKPYVPLKTVFRYIRFKVELTSPNTSTTPEVNTFNIIIDVPDVIKSGSSAVIAGGSTASYGYTFVSSPAVVATATESGKRAEVTGTPGITNFSVKVYNTSGTDVGGNINWIAKGY